MFHTALAYAIERGFDLIVSIDADGQFDPAWIPRLIAPVVAGEADFVTASRFKDPALIPKMPRIKRWGNRLMSRLISRMAGQANVTSAWPASSIRSKCQSLSERKCC